MIVLEVRLYFAILEKRQGRTQREARANIGKKEASAVYFPAVTSESWSTSGAERLTTLPSRRM